MAQNDEFVIDYNKQESLKRALEAAIAYCKEFIPKCDPLSKQGLESLKTQCEDNLEGIGNSFVVGHFE